MALFQFIKSAFWKYLSDSRAWLFQNYETLRLCLYYWRLESSDMIEFPEPLTEMNANKMWLNRTESWRFDPYLYGPIIIAEHKLRAEYFKKLKTFVFPIDFKDRFLLKSFPKSCSRHFLERGIHQDSNQPLNLSLLLWNQSIFFYINWNIYGKL